MDQTVWNVFHGNGFTLTDPMGERQESRLAVHADYLLVLMAPLYAIWSDPRMLLVVQTLVMCAGALPLYWYALEKTKSKRTALLFGILYLLYPPLERMLLHDFHAVALSTTFLLFAFWYLEKEKYIPFIICSVFAALGKEQIWLITGMMGVYLAFAKRRWMLGMWVAGISFLVFYLLFWKFIPAVTPAHQHFALVYLSEFGGDLNGILKNIITNPFEVMRSLLSSDRLFYYYELFIPVGMASLFSPGLLVFALPNLFINAISNNSLMRQIDYQYTSAITPFLFLSAVNGYVMVRKKFPAWYLTAGRGWKIPVPAAIVICCAVASSYAWGELPFERQARLGFFTSQLPEKKIMQQVERMVPSDASVSVTNNIGAHFSQRKILYNFPVGARLADYVIVYLGDPYAWPSGDEQKKTLESLLADTTGYERIAAMGNFYALRKK